MRTSIKSVVLALVIAATAVVAITMTIERSLDRRTVRAFDNARMM